MGANASAVQLLGLRRLLRYLVALYRQDFHGEVVIPFHGDRKIGKVTVTSGYVAESIPAVTLGGGDEGEIEGAIRGDDRTGSHPLRSHAAAAGG